MNNMALFIISLLVTTAVLVAYQFSTTDRPHRRAIPDYQTYEAPK